MPDFQSGDPGSSPGVGNYFFAACYAASLGLQQGKHKHFLATQ
jgi:hypothetical protein